MTLRRLGAILSAIAVGLAIVAAVIGAETVVPPRREPDRLRPEPGGHRDASGVTTGEGFDGPAPLPHPARTVILRPL
jgi:hypothetical protein